MAHGNATSAGTNHFLQTKRSQSIEGTTIRHFLLWCRYGTETPLATLQSPRLMRMRVMTAVASQAAVAAATTTALATHWR
jgi:hypothetical protein